MHHTPHSICSGTRHRHGPYRSSSGKTLVWHSHNPASMPRRSSSNTGPIGTSGPPSIVIMLKLVSTVCQRVCDPVDRQTSCVTRSPLRQLAASIRPYDLPSALPVLRRRVRLRRGGRRSVARPRCRALQHIPPLALYCRRQEFESCRGRKGIHR